MKKTRIIIPYLENKEKPILIALSKIREYSNMKFEEIGVLRDLFHEKKDVSYEIPTEKLAELLDRLKTEDFVYLLVDV
jgi:hypothetical protein